eukprot:GFUD01019637.1.p1 GENE.GFUD01019637.1~~GFUD01019637.1.p1  ORF type:complete len:334 (-),score=81.63 GFUD01019637.1:93-1094(-)
MNSNKVQQAGQSSHAQVSVTHTGGDRQRCSPNKENPSNLPGYPNYSPTTSVPFVQHSSGLIHQSGSGRNYSSTSSVHPKTEPAKFPLPLLLASMPRFVMPVQQALASTEQGGVLDQLDLQGLWTSHLRRSQGDTDSEMRSFYSKMEVFSQLMCRGLVHCGGREVMWTVLGETGEVHEEDVDMEGSHVKGEIQGTMLGSSAQDNFKYDNSEACYRNNTTKEVKDISKLELKEDVCKDDSYSYLDTLGRVTRSTLSSLMTAVAGKATEDCEDREEETLHARSSRVLRRERRAEMARLTDVVNSDEAEETEPCPMCGEKMGLEKLLVHAVACQGTS